MVAERPCAQDRTSGKGGVRRMQRVFQRLALLLSVAALLVSPTPLTSASLERGVMHAAASAGTQTGSETPWWREVNVVSSYVIPPDLEDLVNVVGWGNYVELPEQQESVWLKTGKLHFRDGRYVGSISANDAMYETYLERPELADAAVIGIHGRPLTVTWECTPEQPRWWGNTNHPVWQAFLLEQGQALVDGGVDGIVIDEIGGTAGSIGSGGSFGEPDMSLFRAYLSDVYTPQELFDQFGIEDIETFDYGDHIRDHGLADEWLDEEQQAAVPLYDDFLRFQRLAAFDVMGELIRETKSYALTTYGRDVTFTANLGGLWNHGIIYADLVDYITVEYPYSYFGYPPQSQAVAATKLARALEDKPAVLFHSLSTVADLVNQGPVTEMMKIHIAEAYATRGTLMTPHVLAAPGGGEYSADTAALKPFYRFVIENAFLYRDPESLAQVAVLYSVASDYFHGGYHDNLWGLHFALLDGQVQYDVVTAGDDVWMPDTLAAEDLEPYRLVLLPADGYLSDAQVEVLLAYAAEGGTIVAWGDVGVYDETGTEVERPELGALTTPGTHSYGAGRFVVLTGDPGRTYRETHSPAVRRQLVSLVDEYADPVTDASAERTLNVHTYARLGTSQLVAHLINYDYAIETDQVTPTGAFTMTLRPPEGLLDQGEVQLYLLSPQRSEPSLLDVTINNSVLMVDHPGVEIYDVLLALTEADARALAEVPLASLEAGIAQAVGEGQDVSALDDLLGHIDDVVAAGNHLLARQLGLDALDQLHHLTRPRILFDEAHDEKNTLSWERACQINPEHPEWIHFGALEQALEDDFVFERNPDVPLSAALLQDYDILMLAAPREAFAAGELDAIDEFVRSGGGLVLVGDHSLDEPLSTVGADYGIAFDRGDVFAPIPVQDGGFVIDTFTNHPATENVPYVMTNWGQSLSLEETAASLAFTSEDAWLDTNWNGAFDAGEPTGPFTIAAAYESGRARVAAVGDNAFQDDGFEWRSNDLLIRSLLTWVARWHPPYGRQVYLPLVLCEGNG